VTYKKWFGRSGNRISLLIYRPPDALPSQRIFRPLLIEPIPRTAGSLKISARLVGGILCDESKQSIDKWCAWNNICSGGKGRRNIAYTQTHICHLSSRDKQPSCPLLHLPFSHFKVRALATWWKIGRKISHS